jgi:hypothetical protein
MSASAAAGSQATLVDGRPGAAAAGAADISITDSQRPTSARPSSMTALSTVSTAREAPMAGLLA